MQGELTAHTKELLGGQKTVILFNEEKYSVQKFEEIDQRLYDVGWKAQYFFRARQPQHPFCQCRHQRGGGRSGCDLLHSHRRRFARFRRVHPSRVFRGHALGVHQLRQPIYETVQRNFQRRHAVAKRVRVRGARVRSHRRTRRRSGGRSRASRLPRRYPARKRRFFLFARTKTDRKPQSRREGGQQDRRRRTHGVRQDDAHQSFDALLRSERGQYLRGRRQREGHSAGRIPQTVRHGAAGGVF